jgi:hypothetical protein
LTKRVGAAATGVNSSLGRRNITKLIAMLVSDYIAADHEFKVTETHIEKLIADQGAPIAAFILTMALNRLASEARRSNGRRSPDQAWRDCIHAQSALEKCLFRPGPRLTKSGWIRLMRRLGYRPYRGRGR